LRYRTQVRGALSRLVGDAALAAATIVYAGPLTEPFRRTLLSHWVDAAARLGVAVDEAFDLHTFLQWRDPFSKRLPRGVQLDSHTRETLLMVSYSQQWPLLVDPAGEGMALLHRLRGAGAITSLSFARKRESLTRQTISTT
jgi:hypothetical protein